VQGVSEVVQHLVTPPGRGRPREVQALNSAGIALLSAHLQGFLMDLQAEVAHATLDGKVSNFEALLETARMRGNPNQDNITRSFNCLGYSRVLDGISWQRMSNTQLRAKLRAFNELRNSIVHGRRATVKKSVLTNYLAVFRSFAEHLDRKLQREVRALTGADPWGSARHP
jgi:RiboL-PSP-HEPN